MRRTDDMPVRAIEDDTTYAGRVRLNATKYVRSVIDDAGAIPDVSSFDDLQIRQIKMLGGGKDAVTYLMGMRDNQWMIKLCLHGIEAEAEALNKWADAGANVPTVVSHGVVPVTSRITPSVKYIVEEAVTDKFARLTETCEDYLMHSGEAARKIGRLMGNELAKIHSTTSNRSFGDYGDRNTNTAPYKSWNTYLLAALRSQQKRLFDLGVSTDDYKSIQLFIEQCRFVKKGSYLHGDFGVRNAVIQPYHNRVTLLDPNPLIGDPSWDTAVMFNNYEFRKRRFEQKNDNHFLMNRDLQLLIGFRQGYYLDLPDDNLLTARLMQALYQTEYQERRLARGNGDHMEVKVRQEFIRDIVGIMSRKVRDA